MKLTFINIGVNQIQETGENRNSKKMEGHFDERSHN